MKKIFIASHAMEIGGAERSLLGLLESIDYTEFQVDLMLYRHAGELMDYIPAQVHLLPENKQLSCLAVPVSDVIKKRQFHILWGRFLAKQRAKQKDKKNKSTKESIVGIEYSHKYVKKYISPINPQIEYDLAISFLTPHYIVAEKIRAKKKIAWIHTDYSSVYLDEDSEWEMWDSYDNIVSISEKCTEGFLSIFPNAREKIIEIENILSDRLIQKKVGEFSATDEIKRQNNDVILLSIGRFCEAKNFENIPEICSSLIQKGIRVKWYIIGFGGMEDAIRANIKLFKMENVVHILGKKENPYPYIAACDIYVQPSRYEGKCVTVREAQFLHKPVIITNYSTATSQVRDGIDGMIVPIENQGCAKKIAEIIQDTELQQKLISNTYKFDYTNAGEIKKLEALVNGQGE